MSLSGIEISGRCFKNYLYFLCTLSSWHFHDALWQRVTLLTSLGTTHHNSLITFNLFLMSLVQLAHFLLPVEVTSDNLKIEWPDCACCLLLASILFSGALKIGTGKCHKTCLSASTGRVELLITTTKIKISCTLRNVTCSACGSFYLCTLQRQGVVLCTWGRWRFLFHCMSALISFNLKLRHNKFFQSLRDIKKQLILFYHSNLPLQIFTIYESRLILTKPI